MTDQSTRQHQRAWHVTMDQDGSVSLEAWNGARKLTIYVEAEGGVSFVKVWGANTHTEMSDGVVSPRHTIPGLREWLRNGH
jgi:hypothetical protein